MYLANILGPENWIIILVVVLLLFGGKKIPELMRGVGRGVGELHKGIAEGKEHFTQAMHEDPPQPTVTTPVESQPRQAGKPSTPEAPV